LIVLCRERRRSEVLRPSQHGPLSSLVRGLQGLRVQMRTLSWSGGSGPEPALSRKDTSMTFIGNSAILTLGVMTMTTQLTATDIPDAATDPRIDPQIRVFLAELNKDPSPFWELPQPRPQEILTGLQNKTPVDISGVTTVERTIAQDGRSVKLYIMT